MSDKEESLCKLDLDDIFTGGLNHHFLKPQKRLFMSPVPPRNILLKEFHHKPSSSVDTTSAMFTFFHSFSKSFVPTE